MVLQVKINVGVKMLYISKPMLRVLLEMCFLPVNLSHILEPSQPNWDIGSGRNLGYPTSLKKKSPWPKESNPSSSSPLKPLRLDGKMKVFLKITWVSKMLLLFHHVQGGHFLLIPNCKVPIGLEALKETIYPQSALIKSTGWDNSQRISLKEEQSC